MLEEKDWSKIQDGVEVNLVADRDDEQKEQYVLCRCSARRQKEAAMIDLSRKRPRAQLDKTHAWLQKGTPMMREGSNAKLAVGWVASLQRSG